MAVPPEDSTVSGARPGALEDNARRVPGGYLFAGKVYKYDYGRIVSRLGKESDYKLAREIGCARTIVQRLRQELDIPPWDRFAPVRPLLGQVPDQVLAKRHGLDADAIGNLRRRLGIPPADAVAWRKQRKLIAYVEALRSE